MSPRYEPPIVTVNPPVKPEGEPADVAYADDAGRRHAWRGKGHLYDPYYPQVAHQVPDGTVTVSWLRDLLVVAESQQRVQGTLSEPLYRVNDPGPENPPPFGWPTLDEAKERLARLGKLQRDLSAAGANDLLRPSAPGYLIKTWGRAAVATGTLFDVFERQPLERGMVDTVSNVPTVKIPRLTVGPATAVQTAENAAVTEVDAQSTSASAPVATIAGQEDVSRQLFEFSQPAIDEVVVDALARDFGAKFDSQLINGSAAGGQTRGLLQVASILSVTGDVSTAQAFVASIWKAASQLAGASGFGDPNPADYVVILAPRRLAWLQGNLSYPATQLLPGRVVTSGGVPLSLGASTNEDVALVVQRDNVLVLGNSPQFRVFEQIGSSTQTVRISGWGSMALLVRNPTSVAKVTGLTAPTGF